MKEFLLKFANISAITYENPSTATTKFKAMGYRSVTFMERDNAEGYFLEGPHEYVLSFRGTEVSQKSDIVADLKVKKVTFTSGRGRVHSGFFKETQKLLPYIHSLKFDPFKPLYITGHSLGAAIATIVAAVLGDKASMLITFGSPRVGTADFVKSINVNHYRVQNNDDDVPLVPSRMTGYRHHGENVYINYYGQLKQYGTWEQLKDMLISRLRGIMSKEYFKGINDHLMASYIAKLSMPE